MFSIHHTVYNVQYTYDTVYTVHYGVNYKKNTLYRVHCLHLTMNTLSYAICCEQCAIQEMTCIGFNILCSLQGNMQCSIQSEVFSTLYSVQYSMQCTSNKRSSTVFLLPLQSLRKRGHIVFDVKPFF